MLRHDEPSKDGPQAAFTAKGPGTGEYTVADRHGVVFVGFAPASPLDLGVLRIEHLDTPFVSMTLVPADPSLPIASADKLLLTVVARSENTGMVRTADRTSVTNQWGTGPVRIEVVKGTVSLPGGYDVYAITPAGERGEAINTTLVDGRCTIPLGGQPTVWYELQKRK